MWFNKIKGILIIMDNYILKIDNNEFDGGWWIKGSRFCLQNTSFSHYWKKEIEECKIWVSHGSMLISLYYKLCENYKL